MTDNFQNLAKKTLDDIFNLADKKSQDFDVDFEGENLIIEINDSTFVLSIHNPTQQIWMSSPVSGAHHFEYKEEGSNYQWISTRDDSINLFDKLDEYTSPGQCPQWNTISNHFLMVWHLWKLNLLSTDIESELENE